MLPYIIMLFLLFIPSVVGAHITVGTMVPIGVAVIILLMLLIADIILFCIGHNRGNSFFWSIFLFIMPLLLSKQASYFIERLCGTLIVITHNKLINSRIIFNASGHSLCKALSSHGSVCTEFQYSPTVTQ